MSDEVGYTLIGLFIVGLLIGALFVGGCANGSRYQREAIGKGYAEYDAKSGAWRWK